MSLIKVNPEKLARLPGYEPLTLEKVRAQIDAQIRGRANALRSQITQEVSASEAGAWTNKEAEALAVVGGAGPNDAPMLAAEAQARQITLGEVADRVLVNAQAWRILEGQIAGTSGYHRDRISELQTVEALRAYDWSSGWPGVA